jgi:co-chaperonin GroES (HSP10)
MTNSERNTSGINPKGNKILVLPEEVETTSKGGILLVEDTVEKEEMAQVYGKCVAVGDMCFAGCVEPWCVPGDRIIFAKYSGQFFKGLDGKMYRLIRDKEVIATVDQATGENNA